MPAILLDTIFNPWDELQRYQAEHLQAGHFGATATFVGTMRDFNINESVSHMTLEHYPAMTQHYLDKLCESSTQMFQLDDCLIQNDKGHIAEASSSNVFVLRRNKLLTPPISSGCKDGTMRQVVLKLAQELGLQVVEKHLKRKRLLKADEIWLTNAVQGVLWVESFQDNKLNNQFAEKMVKALNQSILSV